MADGYVEGDVRALRQMLADCEPYLKDGETPAQCIARNKADMHVALALLAKEKQKSEELRAALQELHDDMRYRPS